MQKLVFTNGGGNTIDLTSVTNGGYFGITNWEGLSGVGLNIQTQTVPFQDGAVFLDALMNQREVSVTVAIQDNNDLSLRYERKRQLISALNPKLGEGVLIYTNDYLSKQIHVIPQLPVFENHNSNDSGTPKASCTFTACNPYWEDLEDTEVTLNMGVITTINNEGDVPCGMTIDIEANNINYPLIRNLKNNKKILLEGVFNSNIHIDTEFGKKQVISAKGGFVTQIANVGFDQIMHVPQMNKYFVMSYLETSKYYGISRNWQDWFISNTKQSCNIAYSYALGYFVNIRYNGIYRSYDGEKWEKFAENTNNFSIYFTVARSEELGIFMAVYGQDVYISSDGTVWQKIPVDSSFTGAGFVQWVDKAQKFYISTWDDVVWTYDGENWEQLQITGFVRKIIYVEELNAYFAVTQQAKLLKSSDGITWVEITLSDKDVHSVVWNGEKLIISVLESGTPCIYDSSDGTNFTYKNDTQYFMRDMYFDGSRYVGCGINGNIQISENGYDWESIKYKVSNVNNLDFCTSDNKIYAYCGDKIQTSLDGIDWDLKSINVTLQRAKWIKELNLFIGKATEGIVTSTDGITWTLRKSLTSTGLSFCYVKSINKVIGLYFTKSSNTVTMHTLSSSDGITWADNTAGTFTSADFTENSTDEIACSDLTGVIVAGVEHHWFRSTNNGSSWTHYTDSNIDINSLFRVDNDGYFYSFMGTMFKSADGITWSTITLASDVYTDSGAYADDLGMYIAVGEYAGAEVGPAYFTSFDGVNWERHEYNGTGLRQSYTTYSKHIGKFVTGNNRAISITAETGETENAIQRMSKDSDLGLNIEVGANDFICSKTKGKGTFKIRYRQKYIGV